MHGKDGTKPRRIDPAVVQGSPWFESLTPAEAQALAGLLEPVRLAVGDVLFDQDDPGDDLYFLVAGRVALRLSAPTGRDEPFRVTLEAGAVFGEVAPLLHVPRSAAAEAATAVTLWRLSFPALQAALGRGESWAGRVLLVLARVQAQRLLAVNREMFTLLTERRRTERGFPAGARDEEGAAQQVFHAELLGLIRRSMG